MNTLWSVAEGFASGNALAEMKRTEDSVRQGQNHYLTAVHQYAQLWECLGQVQRVLEAASYATFSFSSRCIFALPPVLLAYAASNQWGGQNLYLIYDQIGTLCQMASLVSSVTLVIFGNVAFGVASITFVGLGFLDRNGILPPEARRVIHMTTYPLFLITGLFVGDIFTQVFVAANLATLAMHAALGTNAALEAVPVQRTAVSPNQVTALRYQDLSPEPLHLRYDALPPIPNIDIGILNTLCAAIDWTSGSHQNALERRLAQDARWRDRYRGRYAPDIYLKNQLRLLVHAVKTETILEGEPVNYTVLHNYLKIIADLLPRLDENSRADLLLKLAIDGGEYCGSGKFNTVSDAYLSIASEAATPLPLEIKVLTHLQLQRIRIFQNLYRRIEQATPLNQAAAGIIDHLDIHNYNLVVNLIGGEFGLPNQGAAEDTAARVDPILLAAVAQAPVREVFYNSYTTDLIIESLQEAIGTPALPFSEVVVWWRNWIERQELSEAEKTALRESLSRGELFGEPLEEDTIRYVGGESVNRTSLAEPFIKTMLLEMGILKRSTHVNNT